MANFIVLQTAENTRLIINVDHIECMHELTTRLGQVHTQITFNSGRVVEVDGSMVDKVM